MDATFALKDRFGQTPVPARTGAGQDGTPAFSSDFETFLKMLTTQMKNQDPLNPVESSDFAVQLATFSTVEQQVLTNDLLSDLGAQIGGLGLGQVASWIGLEVDAALPVTFEGVPVPINAEVKAGATAAELVATDARGIVVNRQPTAPQSGPVSWQGLDAAGLPLPNGVYTLTVASLVDDTVIGTADATRSARIAEVRFEAGKTQLVLDNGQEVDAATISALRQ